MHMHTHKLEAVSHFLEVATDKEGAPGSVRVEGQWEERGAAGKGGHSKREVRMQGSVCVCACVRVCMCVCILRPNAENCACCCVV